MLFEPVVGVALAAWLLGERLVADPGRGRARDPRRGASSSSAGRATWRGRATEPLRRWSDERARPQAAGGRPIRILLVDDHAMVRRGMRDFLELHDDLEVVGEAADGVAALEATARAAPGRRVMDLLMPEHGRHRGHGRDQGPPPGVEVVALTSFIDEDRVTAAIEAGASGFLLKDAEADDLAAAIRAAVGGEVHLDPAVAGIVARGMRDRSGAGAGGADGGRRRARGRARRAGRGPAWRR